MIWFTADHHFGHANIIKYTDRPFESAGEMGAELIRRWNEVVRANDEVHHLGDFTLSGKKTAREYFAQLNGKINVLGYSWHHDKRWLPSTPEYHSFVSRTHYPARVLSPMVVLELDNLIEGRYPQVIVLCHYPMAVWDRCHYGSWHLHGHSHGQFESIGLSYDVGVDCNNFRPISMTEVENIMEGNA